MDAIKITLRLCLPLVTLLAATALQTAQGQVASDLQPFAPVTGELDAGAVDDWTLTASAGEVLSFVVEPTDGDLDPVLTLLTNDGDQLISNDDARYPDDLAPVIEALTIPATGVYTVQVGAFGETSGAYALNVLRGYSQLDDRREFDSLMDWSVTVGAGQMRLSAEALELTLSPGEFRAVAVDGITQAAENFSAQVAIAGVTGTDGWIVGMTLRQQDADNYYALQISDRGQWRFTSQMDGTETILSDWVAHPAIAAGRSDFTLGVMTVRGGFDFFYDGLLIGHLGEVTLTEPGQIGVLVGTEIAGSTTSARFDSLITTVPYQFDDEPLLPEQVLTSDGAAMTQQLQRRLLIPADGEMMLTVPESAAEYSNPGVQRFTIGGGLTFENFALGTTMSSRTLTEGLAGCGVFFRADEADDMRYTLAYVDTSGAYGLSPREGDEFSPGIYGENPDFGGGDHHLLIIADGSTLLYYIDGQYVGRLDSSPAVGTIGNAVVNFEGVNTTCRFTNTWLWRW